MEVPSKAEKLVRQLAEVTSQRDKYKVKFREVKEQRQTLEHEKKAAEEQKKAIKDDSMMEADREQEVPILKAEKSGRRPVFPGESSQLGAGTAAGNGYDLPARDGGA